MDKSRFIIRPRHYERQEPSKDSRKVYIYCEGSNREYKYFLFFSGLSTNINIIPIPSKDGKTDPEKLMQAAIIDFEGNAFYPFHAPVSSEHSFLVYPTHLQGCSKF